LTSAQNIAERVIVHFRLSDTPGAIRWSGRKKGEDNESVYPFRTRKQPETAR